VQRSTGQRLGRPLFAPVRSGIAMRLLVAGGSRPEQETKDRFDARAWTAPSAYGLAETASPAIGRKARGRGRSRAATEPEIWALFIATVSCSSPARPTKSSCPATERRWPRRIWSRSMAARSKSPRSRVLDANGALVALVRPDRAKLRDRARRILHDGIRVTLVEKERDLPSRQRFSRFVLTDKPLPHTRLGKYGGSSCRHSYAEALAGGARRATHALTPQAMAGWKLRSHCRIGWKPISPKAPSPAFGQSASCRNWQSSGREEPARHRTKSGRTLARGRRRQDR
jgi:hypothetical protein